MQYLTSFKYGLIGVGMALSFLSLGVYLLYEIDTTIDYNIIITQIHTNQTFVDSLDCENIELTLRTARLLVSPTQQDEVNQLIDEFERLELEKECKV